MKKKIFLLCFVIQILVCSCENDAAKNYLTKYAYLGRESKNPLISSLTDESQFTSAVKNFQRIAGIQITGELNNETKEMMALPRCGMADYTQPGSYARRRKRYALYGTKWQKTKLTYKFNNYSPDLDKDVIEQNIQKALEYWQSVSRLTFEKSKRSTADIEISFQRKNHGDTDPFDGQGGTLAHAFFPSSQSIGGDAHFDEDETWTVGSQKGTNLLQVAVHEFGHSLGLSHSDVKESIMAPFYRGYSPDLKLNQDDIRGIQTLYGAPTEGKNIQTAPPPKKPGLCSIDKPDAIFSIEDYILLFKGDKLYLLDKLHDNRAQERDASTMFYKFPGNIDAALYRDNSLLKRKIFFFKVLKFAFICSN